PAPPRSRTRGYVCHDRQLHEGREHLMEDLLVDTLIASASGVECQVPKSRTLALSSVWHLALWHSAPFGTWHFGTQLRLALGTLALSSFCHLSVLQSARFVTWLSGIRLVLRVICVAGKIFMICVIVLSLSRSP